jgi:hypothetical protein
LALFIPPTPPPVLIQGATCLSAAELEQIDGRVVRVRGVVSVPYEGMSRRTGR